MLLAKHRVLAWELKKIKISLNKINFRQKEQTREAHHITINNKTSIT